MIREKFLRRIESEESQIVDLCRTLVQIPSENPPGDTQALCNYISSLFKEKGLEYKIYAPQNDMPNFVAQIKGKEKGKRMVLNGHMDTYPAGDHKLWKKNPFSGDLENGKIFGRSTDGLFLPVGEP